MGTTDSRLLHSLRVAKMSSEVNSFPSATLDSDLCYFKSPSRAYFTWDRYLFIDFHLQFLSWFA